MADHFKRQRDESVEEVPDSEPKRQARERVAPATPTNALSPSPFLQSQQEVAGEGSQQPSVSSSESGLQESPSESPTLNLTSMDLGNNDDPQASSAASNEPPGAPEDDEPGNIDDAWDDPACFPIVVDFQQTHIVTMASTKWDLDWLRLKILLDLQSQLGHLGNSDNGEPIDLEVRWEMDLALVIKNPKPFPEVTAITEKNVRAVLENLKKRGRSDLVVVRDPDVQG